MLGPPNSAKLFRQTAKLNVYMVELDTQITSDGVIVVNHSDRIMDAPGRNCSHDGLRIHLTAYSKVKKVRCADEPLPTLAEVLEIFKDTDIRLNVEIKAWDNHGSQPKKSLQSDTRTILRYLDDAGYEGRYIVSFFDWRFLIDTVREVHPDLYVIALERSSKMQHPTSQMYQSVRDAAAAGANSFEPDLPFTQEDLLRFIREQGMDPQIWYANTPADVRFALAHGIDPISSDDPLMAQDVIDAASGATLAASPKKHSVRATTVLNKRLKADKPVFAKVIGGTGLVPRSGQGRLAWITLAVTTDAKAEGTFGVQPRNAGPASRTIAQFPSGEHTFTITTSPGDFGEIEVRASTSAKVTVRLQSYHTARYRLPG